jgi:intracellular sulfur oxidation DsrE/DsrF family protein
MSAPILAIVERAFRGTVEQQYAHVLWLAHGLSRQAEIVVLLRGAACAYAVAPDGTNGDVEAGGLDIAGQPWGITPDYHDAIARMGNDGVRIYACARSLSAFGFAGRALLPEVRPISTTEMVDVITSCDRICYL